MFMKKVMLPIVIVFFVIVTAIIGYRHFFYVPAINACRELSESSPLSMTVVCGVFDKKVPELIVVDLEEDFAKELMEELLRTIKKGKGYYSGLQKISNFVNVEIHFKNGKVINLEFWDDTVKYGSIYFQVGVDEVNSLARMGMCPSEECTRAEKRRIEGRELYDGDIPSRLFEGALGCRYCN